MRDELTKALVRALEENPCSERALAKEAGISPALLAMIRAGDREATGSSAAAIAEALGRWRKRVEDAERDLRKALDQYEDSIQEDE